MRVKKKKRPQFSFSFMKLILLYSIILYFSILFCCETTTQLISQDIDTSYKQRSINNILICGDYGYQSKSHQNIIRKNFTSELKKYGIKTFSDEDIFGKDSYLSFKNGHFEIGYFWNAYKKILSDSVITILKSNDIDIVLYFSQNEYVDRIINFHPSFNRTKFTGLWTYTYNETNFIYRNAILSGYPLEFKIEKIYTSSYLLDVNLNKRICYYFTTTDKINSSGDFQKIARSYTKLIIEQMQINHLINN